MAFEFEKLSEVGSLDEFPEGAKVLIEHNGDIKRCAADGLGDNSKVLHGTAVIGNEMTVSVDEPTTFEELKALILAGTPAKLILATNIEGVTVEVCISMTVAANFEGRNVIIGSDAFFFEAGIMGIAFGYEGENVWTVLHGK